MCVYVSDQITLDYYMHVIFYDMTHIKQTLFILFVHYVKRRLLNINHYLNIFNTESLNVVIIYLPRKECNTSSCTTIRMKICSSQRIVLRESDNNRRVFIG